MLGIFEVFGRHHQGFELTLKFKLLANSVFETRL